MEKQIMRAALAISLIDSCYKLADAGAKPSEILLGGYQSATEQLPSVPPGPARDQAQDVIRVSQFVLSLPIDVRPLGMHIMDVFKGVLDLSQQKGIEPAKVVENYLRNLSERKPSSDNEKAYLDEVCAAASKFLAYLKA